MTCDLRYSNSGIHKKGDILDELEEDKTF